VFSFLFYQLYGQMFIYEYYSSFYSQSKNWNAKPIESIKEYTYPYKGIEFNVCELELSIDEFLQNELRIDLQFRVEICGGFSSSQILKVSMHAHSIQ
jgi:hypothetical protein